jgi:hypothetical protein
MARQDEMIAQMEMRQKELEEEQAKGREEGGGEAGAGDTDDEVFETEFHQEVLVEVNREYHLDAWYKARNGTTYSPGDQAIRKEIENGTKVLKALKDTTGNVHYVVWPAEDRNKSILPHHLPTYSEYDEGIDTSPGAPPGVDPDPVKGDT